MPDYIFRLLAYRIKDEAAAATIEELKENHIISTDLKQLALLTLYADYQILALEERVEDIYLYFTINTFRNLHIEDMFSVGREALEDTELRENVIEQNRFYMLNFYMGNFEKVKNACINPKGSLGWSDSFIRYGIRLILLYLYECDLPSKAASSVACYVGFSDNKNNAELLEFEQKIVMESQKLKVSTLWNYFQRWKSYFAMDDSERKRYILWAEKIVYSRADAIVSGQHRNQYGEVAYLLAIVAEIKVDMELLDSTKDIFDTYKRKFPRHSLFQAEMKNYFNVSK